MILDRLPSSRYLFYNKNVNFSIIRLSTTATSESTNKEDDWFNVESSSNIDERIVEKPISYLPDHLPQTRKRQRQKPWWKFRYFVDINNNNEKLTNEWTEKPEYPPIYDSTREGLKKQIRMDWYRAIRNLPTAEQKIYEITKHYGHLSYMINPTILTTYNSLPIQKYITRTRLINHLPKSLISNNIDEEIQKKILKILSNRLYQSKTRFSTRDFRKTTTNRLKITEQNRIKSIMEDDLIADIVQLLIQNKFKNNNTDYHIDYNPYVSQSWWLNNCPIPFKKQRWFHQNDHINQLFTYRGNHSLHVRTSKPMVNFNDEIETDNQDDNNETSKEEYNLLKMGVQLKRQNIMSLPGFWPSHSNNFDFPLLLVMNYEQIRQYYHYNQKFYSSNNQEIDQDLCDGMAILSGFNWLTSLANNLGFTLYDKLLYPLRTLIIITNGQSWSFYLYQLNNHCFHDDLNQDNDCVKNICWSSGIQHLYDSYDGNDGFKNLNTNVLNLLINLLPSTSIDENEDLEYRPYLNNLNNLNEMDKQELQYSLRRKFSNQIDLFVARRKKTNLWEKIYKNHKESLMDVKRIRPKIEMKYPPFFK